jgi:hypothetical protein
MQPISLPVVKLEILSTDLGTGKMKPISTATGFLVTSKKSILLVSNWHNFSGRDPENRKPIDKQGRLPEAVRVFVRIAKSGFVLPTPEPFEETLFNGDGSPRWIELPERKPHPEESVQQKIDLAALVIQNRGKVPKQETLGHEGHPAPDLVAETGDGIGIIGYPYGRSGAGSYPLWVFGHVSSDVISHPDKEYFLVNASGRSAMSGSLVVLMEKTYVSFKPGFLGVYSGRIDQFEIPDPPLRDPLDIGIVWRWSLAEKIIALADSLP